MTLGCQHWWCIAPPAGPTSQGICERCGAQAEFRNSEDYYGPDHRTKAHVQYSTPGDGMHWAEVYRD